MLLLLVNVKYRMYNVKPAYFSLKIMLLFTDFSDPVKDPDSSPDSNPDMKRLFRFRIGSGQKFWILPVPVLDPNP